MAYTLEKKNDFILGRGVLNLRATPKLFGFLLPICCQDRTYNKKTF